MSLSCLSQQIVRRSRNASAVWILAGCLLPMCWSCGRKEATGQPVTPIELPVMREVAREGEDWPCFLGPRHDGTSLETKLLESWPAAGPPVLWRMETGNGYSAPSVLGSRLVLHHRRGNEDIVECLDAENGTPLWQHRSPTRFRDPYGYSNGPRCTPLLTPDRCYTLASDGRLTCLKLTNGEPVWERNLKAQFQIPEGFFGVGATPLLEGDKLIVCVGGQPDSGVVAFDPVNGEILWQSVGRSTWEGALTSDPNQPRYEWTGEEMIVSYSSPMAVTIHGQRHLLCLMRQGLVSLDPQTGAERFHFWFRSRAEESVNASAPVVVGDMILLGNAYRVGSACLRVAPDGKSSDVVWRDDKILATHWSTTIHHAGAFFGFSGRHENEGTLQCVEAGTGKLLWEYTGLERLAELEGSGKADFDWPAYGRGSAILADGKFIVLAERGSLALVAADQEQFREISLWSPPGMSAPCWTAPVLSRGRLYLRCEETLLCVDLRHSEE